MQLLSDRENPGLVRECFICMYVYLQYMCLLSSEARRLCSGPLELKLLMSVRNHVGSGHCQNIFSTPIDFLVKFLADF